MAIISSLANHLLIAMPSLKDPNFERSVVYLCEHNEQGSVGLMINRPLQFPLSIVFEQLQIEPIRVEKMDCLYCLADLSNRKEGLLFISKWVDGAPACFYKMR